MASFLLRHLLFCVCFGSRQKLFCKLHMERLHIFFFQILHNCNTNCISFYYTHTCVSQLLFLYVTCCYFLVKRRNIFCSLGKSVVAVKSCQDNLCKLECRTNCCMKSAFNVAGSSCSALVPIFHTSLRNKRE